MAAVIENVNIDDVFPLVDEHGNDLATRDYSIKENKEYVKELARSMRAKGIPDEMVTLVRDGGIFRVKAGNSRVMAMRELGTKTFPAIVEDDGTLQEVIATVIRTNTKKKYEAVEESQFVRQLALFSDDDYVAEVSGIDKKDVAKIRVAAKVVEDAADDMSLLRLITIGEFADDPEAVEALTNCTEREYVSVARRFENRRSKEKSANELILALKDRGVELVEDGSGMTLIANINKAQQIPESLPDGAVAVRHSTPGFFMILSPCDEESEHDDEEIKQQAEIEAFGVMFLDGLARRRAWLADQLKENKTLSRIARRVKNSPTRFTPMVSHFLDSLENSIELDVGQSEIVSMFETMNYLAQSQGEINPESYIEMLDILQADGYEPDEDEQRIYEKALEFAGGE